MSARPATPATFARGAEVFARSRRCSALGATRLVVTRQGRVWLYVVRPERLGAEFERDYERAFLLADMTEGRRNERTSYVTLATPEQLAYDVQTERAESYLRNVAMLEIPTGSPFRDRGRMMRLVELLRAAGDLLPEVGPDA